MSDAQSGREGRIPPGPGEPYYSASQDLLSWMSDHFHRYGDIYKASIDGFDAYVVSSPDYAEHVLRKNWQNYRKGWAIKRVAFLLGNGLMVSEGDFWQSQRRMIQPAFHRNAIGALIKVITEANVALLKRWEHAARNRMSVNVTRDVSVLILQLVLTVIFGADSARVMPSFSMLSDESARTLEFAQAFRALRELVHEVVAQRRAESTNATDILGTLMAARDRDSGQVMPDGQLINEIMTLIVAGHETTASVLNWAWYLLSQHPEVDEKLSSELGRVGVSAFPGLDDLPRFAYTRQVLEEVLRLYPPGWLMTRRAVGDDRLGEYFVPADTEIYVSPYLIQRHPGLWEAPDRFDPDRFDAEHSKVRHALAMLPFSAGPRNCIGESLARVEMQIHLMTIAKRLRFRYAETKPPELDAGVNLRSKHDFIMTPEIR